MLKKMGKVHFRMVGFPSRTWQIVVNGEAHNLSDVDTGYCENATGRRASHREVLHDDPSAPPATLQFAMLKSQTEPVRLASTGKTLDGVFWIYQGQIYKVVGLRREEAKRMSSTVAKQEIEELCEWGLRARERIPRDVQRLVWDRDGGRCVQCGSQENLEFDHMIPVSRGGANTVQNIQLLCQQCNRSKGTRIGGCDTDSAVYDTKIVVTREAEKNRDSNAMHTSEDDRGHSDIWLYIAALIPVVNLFVLPFLLRSIIRSFRHQDARYNARRGRGANRRGGYHA